MNVHIVSFGRHRVSQQRLVSYGQIWFLRLAQYAQRLGVVSCERHRVSLCAYNTRSRDVLRTVCRMDAIAFRDVHNTHDVRAYAPHEA